MEQQSQAVSKQSRRPRRRRVGVVVSDKRDKTIKVQFEYLVEHARYGKRVRRRGMLHAHDPDRQARVGDRVLVMECRPISKTKSWRLEKILVAAARPSGS